MSRLQITNFELRARVEISRLVLAYSGRSYDFVPVTFDDWYSKVKATIPTGSLPCMTLDGVQYGQSVALQSYLAEEAGIYGDSALDRLVINQLSCIREDLIVPEIDYWKVENKYTGADDPNLQAEKKKNMIENVYPKYLKLFTDLIQKRSGPFVLGEKFSLADIVVYEAFKTLSNLHNEVLLRYPVVCQLREKVAAMPGIKEYLSTATNYRL